MPYELSAAFPSQGNAQRQKPVERRIEKDGGRGLVCAENAIQGIFVV